MAWRGCLPTCREIQEPFNRRLRAWGHPQRLRVTKFALRHVRMEPAAWIVDVTLDAEAIDAPEVERRISERYLWREGD